MRSVIRSLLLDGAAAWTPKSTSVAPLAGWDLTLLAGSNGDAIASIPDQVSGAFPLVQAVGGSKPTTTDNIIGGLRAGLFSTDDFVSSDGVAASFTGTGKPLSALYVMRPTSFATTAKTVASLAQLSSNTQYHKIARQNTGGNDQQVRREVTGGVVTLQAVAALAANSNYAFAHTFDGTNGVLKKGTALVTDTGVISTAATVALTGFTIGCFRGSSNSEFAEMYLGEFWLYAATLTATDILNFMNYANKKYGTT